MVSVTAEAVRSQTPFFYVGMAVTCVVVAFAGFTPTYWSPLLEGNLSELPLVHLHGLLFTAWTLFLVTQASLASAGRFDRHRPLGLFGIALATAMLLVGLAVAIHSMHVQIDAGFGERARSFLIVPVTTICFFAGTVAVAIANVRRPETHKRLMLLATIAILMAAVARLVRAVLGVSPTAGPPPVEMSFIPALATDLLIVAPIVYDWRTRGRPHPVWVVGGGLWVALQLGRIPLSHTAAWLAVADWLAGFSR